MGHARGARGRHFATQPASAVPTGERLVPKRNFGYEKRQKELNKQRKREEKQQRKLDRANTAAQDAEPASAPESELPPRE